MSRSLPSPPGLRERGAALLTSLVSFALVALFSIGLISSVQQQASGVEHSHERARALKLAEGLLEMAEQELVDTIANFRPFPGVPGSPSTLIASSYTQAGVPGAWTVTRATALDGGGVPQPVATAVAPPDPDTGLYGLVDYYVLRSRAQSRGAALQMVRELQLQRIPIFQFMAFYEGDLEVHPGPNMTINGRVHANGDLHVSAAANLDVDTRYMRTAGDLIRRKKTGEVQNGSIRIRDSAEGGGLVTLPSAADLLALGVTSVNGIDSLFTGWDLNGDQRFDQPGEIPPFATEANELYHGTLQTGEHGVLPIGHPAVGTVQPYVPAAGGDFELVGGNYVPVAPGTGSYDRGYYHEQAGLRIVNNQVFDGSGNNITLLMPLGFITTSTLYDAREGGYVPVTRVNMKRLIDMDGNPTTNDPCPYFPANGLIYAMRTGSTPGNPQGIVLTEGRELRGPLTVVSPDPVYVHGDYNNVAKKPAAIITDAINLLSNNWNFSKTPGTLPSAASTTYNVAMITGNTSTVGNSYSGGFENLPRFHENWTNKTCSIRGSFVNLWQSQKADGAWAYGGDRYTAPNRNWNFESDFDTGTLPPFTPMVINARSVHWRVIN